MAHASRDFKTKKAFRAAVAEGERVFAFNPSGRFPDPVSKSTVIEGPWACHRWYAAVVVDEFSMVTKVTG